MKDDSAPLHPILEAAVWQGLHRVIHTERGPRPSLLVWTAAGAGAGAGSHVERHQGYIWNLPSHKAMCTLGRCSSHRDPRTPLLAGGWGRCTGEHTQPTSDWQTQRRQGQGRSWYPKTTGPYLCVPHNLTCKQVPLSHRILSFYCPRATGPRRSLESKTA